ncbi:MULTISPECIES: NAD-dependent protein deacylase [unclassified Paenibacillus]|uniref:NAD-dependent protein deacetylase n=1 Tax=Paenibacillus provencensis TaxID=441151 RepID=A0ABW3PYN8_9BACL|nr:MULTISPECIES: NAD-dependent protein deacylase [unclassified Paenibacillus]MCM3130014.1 NAD-dependent protein deacylase [Paenibacillus sp. MER 78]SFS62162.1 NAD-dependent deacetylase [Paenibacillus sp. 453mf]
MADAFEPLVTWIRESMKIVFFGGAGTSTESGIPDFRSAAGIYQTEQHSPYSPEELLSIDFFMLHPDIFYDFYRSKMLHPHAKPNGAHRLLARLEKEGKLSAVITQNIDGLHQAAGCGKVHELHGSVHRNYCMDCAHFYDLDAIIASESLVPLCNKCNGIIKPDVVLYGESLDQTTLYHAVDALSEADLMIIGGTSLTVQPAAQLVTYFQGKHTVLLNATPTPYDSRAELLITEPIGRVLDQVNALL